MSYFRAILHSNELSRRTYDLTTDVIRLNGGNYTAWLIRRKCIDALDIDTEEEMDFLDENGLDLEKVYQYWHHRRTLVEKRGSHEGEIDFLQSAFESDSKNYHAWTYKMWLVKRFNLWESQVLDIEEKLSLQPTNNSLWSFRYYLFAHTKEFKKEDVGDEVKYSIKVLSKDAKNESAWVYIRGFLTSDEKPAPNRLKFTEFPFLLIFVKQLIQLDENRFAMQILIDFYVTERTPDSMNEAVKLCDTLANSVDRIRKNFWLWKKEKFSEVLLNSKLNKLVV